MNRQRLLQYLLVGVLLIVVAIFLMTGFGDSDSVLDFLDAKDKNDALKFLGAITGGVLVALNVVVANRRAKAMEDAAAAQAEGMKRQAKANRLTEQGLRQERLKNALDRLGSESPVQQFAAAYELVHLARDTEELREPVLAIFCEHIRQTTRSQAYIEQHPTEPSTEMQSLLTLLFVREHSAFRGCRADLEECWLNGVDLRRARIPNANLRGVSLDGARLADACLHGSVLVDAHFKRARLQRACLRECNLMEARMQGAGLTDARLQGATLLAGRLVGAYLRRARLQGADLTDARLHAATLSGAHMQAARMDRACLQGAFLDGTNFQGAGSPPWSSDFSFADRVRSAADREDSLSGGGCHAVFSGGINRERADELAEALPPDTARHVFWPQIEPHFEQPRSFTVPAVTVRGGYSAAEAEAWILEHQSELSEDE